MKKPRTIRISATSLRALVDCSLAFYYERIMQMPSKEWPRTIVGSLVHSLLECLRNPRHQEHLDEIVNPGIGVNYQSSPAVARLVSMWQRKYKIDPSLISDINEMLHVAINCTDFLWTQADIDPVTKLPLIYGPEYAFTVVLDDGSEIRGYIDDMAQVDGIMVVRDYKSAKNKPTQAEVPNNVQAAVYQLFVWLQFGLPARVEFVYLRHGPTKRTPTKHLQIVQPASPTHLQGLSHYISVSYQTMNQFSLEDAYKSPHEDIGFCMNVCSHYSPHPYWVICAKDDPEGLFPLSSHLSIDKANELRQDGEIILQRQHDGCALRWKPTD